MSARGIAWLLAGLCLAPAAVAAAPAPLAAPDGFTDRCDDALRKQQIDELVARLRAVDGPCRLGRIDTAGYRTVIDWHDGERTHTVLVGPRACVREPSHVGADLAAITPPGLAACPAALAAIAGFVATAHPLAPLAGHDGWQPEEPTLADPRIVAACLAILALLLALWLAVRRRRTADDRAWCMLAVGLFGLGLAARFAVTAAPANWYGAFLPPTGWGDLRFGSGAAVVQAAVRALLPWTVDVAFALVRIVGALAVPLVVVLVRRLGGTRTAAALAGLLLALAPIPVRLAASSAEHVFAGTLALAAWVTWLRTAHDPSPVPRLLAITLAALAALTRIDCLPQLALIPLWTTLAPIPAQLPLRRRLIDAAIFLAALAVIAAYGYLDIVRPSHHPGPELHGILQAIKRLFSQFWTVAITPPHWITPPSLALVALGLLAAALQRRWRWLLAILASLALIFIPLGRNLIHDGLAGARYFVLLPALLALTATAVVRSVKARAAVLALTAIGLLELWTASPAWRHETTYQAEHRFLHDALAAPQLAGCTLWFVRPRQPTGEPDLDCCLSPEQSPLALQFKALRFQPMPTDHDPDDATGCHLYYEGSICSLDPTLAPLAPQAAARILAQCDRLRRRPARVLATDVVTPETLTPRFTISPPISLRIQNTH